MQIDADTVELIVAFQLPEPMQYFISGLFLNQWFSIGDRSSNIILHVKQVEALNDQFNEKAIYRLKTLSPIVLGLTDDRFKYPQYILPDHANYASLFINNLLDKLHAIRLQTGLLNMDIDPVDIKFRCLDEKPRSVLQIIKANKEAETKIKAYRYSFELVAPKELVKVGLNTGFGSANAQGFGCCELM
jgi:CRISPR-associated endoribonuclease Cas6